MLLNIIINFLRIIIIILLNTLYIYFYKLKINVYRYMNNKYINNFWLLTSDLINKNQ